MTVMEEAWAAMAARHNAQTGLSDDERQTSVPVSLEQTVRAFCVGTDLAPEDVALVLSSLNAIRVRQTLDTVAVGVDPLAAFGLVSKHAMLTAFFVGFEAGKRSA